MRPANDRRYAPWSVQRVRVEPHGILVHGPNPEWGKQTQTETKIALSGEKVDLQPRCDHQLSDHQGTPISDLAMIVDGLTAAVVQPFLGAQERIDPLGKGIVAFRHIGRPSECPTLTRIP